jgi:hypothetical protein
LASDDLAEVQARRHTGCGIGEPRAQPLGGVPGVTLVAGEQMRGGERGNRKSEGEERVAVRGEGRRRCGGGFG